MSQPENKTEICRHLLAVGTGQKIKKTDHARDKTGSIDERIAKAAVQFTQEELALEWMELLREKKPRYIRDQLDIIQKAIDGVDPKKVAFTLKYCVEKSIYIASDFKAILELQQSDRKAEPNIKVLNPLNGKVTENALIQPEKSNIGEYEAIVNNKKNKKIN